ncbi:MAG: sensor histidine kinase KdpD [Lachnospiraceae bacterium]
MEEKGKLKIFFGYAAGIGKTYAMLESAHMAQENHIDVVAGYIEPHARPATMEMMKGIERIEPQEIEYHNIKVLEFNLDQALLRHPQLILIDELAHTNAAGSRHRKRYEDIKELLNAGIDVYTTVNVQHIESLNDMIAGITNVVVRERIPDSVFDMASQIEMVDIPPQELIQRLEQGKIYQETQAQRALSNFFVTENLVALREIALRRMADWVNQEQENNRDMKERESAATEHILMCLSPSPSNGKVIRQASRMAKAFHGKFTAFYVETSDFSELDKEDMERLRVNTKLAEQLGAKTITSYGNDIVEQIAEYAKIAKVTKIVLGRTYTKRPLFSVRESFSDQLAKCAPQLEIFLIPDTYEKEYIKKKKKKKNEIDKGKFTTDILAVSSMLLCATIISLILDRWNLSDANLIMSYILGVLMVSLLTQYRISSVLYSVLSVFAFNFFFTEPKRTFSVDDPSYIVTFVVMFLTAVLSSSLTQKVKKVAKQAAMKSYRTEILLETSQKLQQSHNMKKIAEVTMEQLGKLLNKEIYCFIGNPMEHSIPLFYCAKGSIQKELPKEELAVAQWTYKNNKHAGFSTTTLPGARCLYLTVRNGEKIFAVVGIEMEGKKNTAFDESIMSAILNESALAFGKEEMIQREQKVAIRLEQEQLRANLLRSISHDLRTPLTSISGNAGMLIGNGEGLSVTTRQQMYEDIYDDSMWLINLVENLLSVTRIENGTMQLNMVSELVDDVISESLKHINRKSKEHIIQVKQEDDMLVAKMDAKLIMQVIINLVDNAIKYTNKGSLIQIITKKEQESIKIAIADNGNGISTEQKEKIFTMFYTGKEGASDGRRGMGLGLALCKSIINAHGGELCVYDNQSRGTVFEFTLHLEEVKLDD